MSSNTVRGGSPGPSWEAWVSQAEKKPDAGQIRSTPEGEVIRARRPLGTHKKKVDFLDKKRKPEDVEANRQSLNDIRVSLQNRFNRGLGGTLFDKFFAHKSEKGRPISSEEISLANKLGKTYEGASEALVSRFGREGEQRIFEKVLSGKVGDEEAFDTALKHAVVAEDLRLHAGRMSPHDLERMIDEEIFVAGKSEGPEREAAEKRLEVLGTQKKINKAAVTYAQLGRDESTIKQQMLEVGGEYRKLKDLEANLQQETLRVGEQLHSDDLELRQNVNSQQEQRERVASLRRELEGHEEQLRLSQQAVKEHPGQGYEEKIKRLGREIEYAKGQLNSAEEALKKSVQRAEELDNSILSGKQLLSNIDQQQKQIGLQVPKLVDEHRRLKADSEVLAAKLSEFENTPLFQENIAEICDRAMLHGVEQGYRTPESLSLSSTLRLHQFVEDMVTNQMPSDSSAPSSSRGELSNLRDALMRARDHHMESYSAKKEEVTAEILIAKQKGGTSASAKLQALKEQLEDLRRTYQPNDKGVVEMSRRMATARSQGPAEGAAIGGLNPTLKEAVGELRRRKDLHQQGLIGDVVFTPDHAKLLAACERQLVVTDMLFGYMREGKNFDDVREKLAWCRSEREEAEKNIKDFTQGGPVQAVRGILPDRLKGLFGDMSEIDAHVAEEIKRRDNLTEQIAGWELLLSFENDPDLAKQVRLANMMGAAKKRDREKAEKNI